MRRASAFSIGAVIVLVPLAIVHGMLRASLPDLDGAVSAVGLAHRVTVERDRLGIATIEAADRADLAFATGFVHAQDRFFQMDLSRRLAAGELAELVGAAALGQDRRTRVFRFRDIALSVLAQSTPLQRSVLEAYARGVNTGLERLRARPWEYWVLGAAPRPWRAEDSILISFSMWWTLQASGFRRDELRREIDARLGGPVCADGWKCALQFFYPAVTSWDAPNSAQSASIRAPTPAIPPPEALDVRSVAMAVPAPAAAAEADIGSNSWAVAGRLTASGAALVANDMHLGLMIPTQWYRARLRLRGADGRLASELNGLTLPGTPLLVAGSNGHIAWGFTNSYGAWLSVTRVDCTAVADDRVTTASNELAVQTHYEDIRVKDAPTERLAVRTGSPGVLIESHPERSQCWFGRWLAQRPEATNLDLLDLEAARSVEAALAIAPRLGIPHQNLVIGDAEGHIGWTIAGRIPRGDDQGRLTVSAGWTTAQDHPRILDPPIGRLWSANARATDDPRQLRLIGAQDASVGTEYDVGARAQQIRDDLVHLEGGATPLGMLAIQLDDRAVFLARWRDLLLEILDAGSLDQHPDRRAFRALIERWDGRADVGSVGYRLVRSFRDTTQTATWRMLLAGLRLDPDEVRGASEPARFESPLWQLVTERPMHLLAAQYRDWPQFLLTQIDATLAALGPVCPQLAACTWGAHRPVSIRHPLSKALPWMSGLLDMPTLELPGDHDMPRVQDGAAAGASERFAVSPGHEAQGYLELPGGQSGHPLSAYYRAGFMDWARGAPTPFLPGTAEHRLLFVPASSR